jgi:hypothetical protein
MDMAGFLKNKKRVSKIGIEQKMKQQNRVSTTNKNARIKTGIGQKKKLWIWSTV